MNKKAQATLEFTLVFVITLLFIVLTVNVFVWLNHCMVRRQVAYEDTRSEAGTTEQKFLWFVTRPGDPGKSDFFTPDNPNPDYRLPKLNVFKLGGRE